MPVLRPLLPALALVAAGGCQCNFLVGTWDFTWTVEEATGACVDEVGEVSTGTITIEAGDGADHFILTGFGTNEDVALLGSLGETTKLGTTFTTLSWSGSYDDDGGTTTSSTWVDVLDDLQVLVGVEEWSWETATNPGACPSAMSSVKAERHAD